MIEQAPRQTETGGFRFSGALRIIGVLLILSLGFGLRAAYYHEPYSNPDERIAVEVVSHMRQTGDWDTNWAKADLDKTLQYDQYNFSAYHYATFLFYRLIKITPGIGGWRSEDGGFWVYRFFSVLLGSIAVVQTYLLTRRIFGYYAAAVAGVLAALSVLLVQDAHYIRPEAFTTVLTLVVVALCLPPAKSVYERSILAALVIGLLVATKVSMLLLAWLPLVPLLGNRRSWRSWIVVGFSILAASLAGFALGAPGAVAHPSNFLNGVRALSQQYAFGHPPHSHLPFRPVADLLAGYFVATLGYPVLIAAIVGVISLVRLRRWTELAVLAGPLVLFAVFFSTRAVFFERNLSHVLPLALILAGCGAAWLLDTSTRALRTPSAAVALGLLVILTLQSARFTYALVCRGFSGKEQKERTAFEASLRTKYTSATWLDAVVLLDWQAVQLGEKLNAWASPTLLRLTDYHDEWGAYARPFLWINIEATPVGSWKAPFPYAPVCTLYTYSAADYTYFVVKPRPPAAK